MRPYLEAVMRQGFQGHVMVTYFGATRGNHTANVDAAGHADDTVARRMKRLSLWCVVE